MLRFKDEQALIRFVTSTDLPEWQKRQFKRNRDAVQVHSQGQLFFKIDHLFPNEHPTSKQHRILAFESITQASFGRAANNVNRIFKNSSYTVEASENTLEELNKNNFEGHNFYTWFLDNWTKFALKEDPNSRFVVYPPEYAAEKERLPVSFVSSDLIKYSTDEALVFISEEESEVTYELKETIVRQVAFKDQSYNGRLNYYEACEHTYAPKFEVVIKRPVYHVFLHGIGFYRIEKLYAKAESKEYEITIYPLDFNLIPSDDVGGEESNKVNRSFLYPFVPFGNLALLQHSQHCAVNFMFSFPRMSEIESPCEAPGCAGGEVSCETEEDIAEYGDRKPCSVCGGSGYKTIQSPYKVYKKRFDPNGDMEGDNKHLAVPDVQFYTPETSILDYSKKEWKDYLDQAETAVYIQQRVKTGNIESAKSKEIDRDDLYSFLSKVGQTYFAKLRFAIQAFENYFNSNPVQVTVQTPFSYAIVGEGEAFEELQKLLESSVPVAMKGNRVESFISKFVSASSPTRKFLDVLKIVDPLLYYSKDELTSYKIAGVISAEQLAVHVFAYPVLQKLYFENKNLFQQETSAIVASVIEELKAFKPPPPPDLKETIKNNMNPGE